MFSGRILAVFIITTVPFWTLAQVTIDDLRHPLVQVRVDALVAVQERGSVSEDELAAIRDLAVNDPSERVRQQAALALASLEPDVGNARALDEMASPSQELRSTAIEVLNRAGPRVLAPVLARLGEFLTADCAEDPNCQPDILATLRLVADLIEASTVSVQDHRLLDRTLLFGLEQLAVEHRINSRDPSAILLEVRRAYVALVEVDPFLALPSLLSVVHSCEVGRCLQFYFPAFGAISWPSAELAESGQGLSKAEFDLLRARLADQLTEVLDYHTGSGRGYINDSSAVVGWAEVVTRIAGGQPSRASIAAFSRIFAERLSHYERRQARPSLARLLPSRDVEWILGQVESQLSGQSSQLVVVDLVAYLEDAVVATGNQEAVFGLVNLLEVAGDAPLAALRRLAADSRNGEVLAPAGAVFTSLLADEYLNRSEPFSPSEFLGLLRLVALLPSPSSCDVVRQVDAIGYEQRTVFASDAQEIREVIGSTLDAVCH